MAKTRPYFPGYLFVRVNLDETGESVLQWAPGSVGLVYRDGRPVIVPEKFILKLKRRTGEASANNLLHQDRTHEEKKSNVQGKVTDEEALFDEHLTDEERVGLLDEWFNS